MDNIRNKIKYYLHIDNRLIRVLLAEFIGTTFLMMIQNGTNLQLRIGGEEKYSIGKEICLGLSVVFGVYLAFETSGGHLNPAMSITSWFLGNLSLTDTLLYSLAQTAGAFTGAAIAFVGYYDGIIDYDRRFIDPSSDIALTTAGCFATYPKPYMSTIGGIIDQIIGTAIMSSCTCAIVDKRQRIPRYLQPLLVGLVMSMIAMSYGINTGSAINPARDFGPRLFTYFAGYGLQVFSYNNYTYFFVPIVGPIIGAIVGAWIYKLFVGLHGLEDRSITSDTNRVEQSNANTDDKQRYCLNLNIQ